MNPVAATGSLASNPLFSAAVLLVITISFLMAVRDRRYVLFSYMLLLPLVTLPLAGGRLGGIPGLSLQNVVFGLGVYALYLSRSRLTQMDRKLRTAFIVYWIAVTLSVVHGIFYLDDLVKVPGMEYLGIYTYLRQYFLLPVLSWISFVVAYRYAASGAVRTLEYLRFFGLAMLVYAVVVLVSVVYYFAQTPDYTMVRDAVGGFIGIHSNDWAFGFAMASPFLIAGAVSNKIVPRSTRLLLWLALTGSVTAILFSYSRSAYIALFLLSFGFAALKKRVLLWLLIPIFAGLVLFGPASVLDRVGFGLTTGVPKQSELDVNTISSGRLELSERALEIITSGVGQTFFGGGRWTFARAAIVEYPGITHPHNAYLELLLDVGVLGFVPILGVYFLMLSRFWNGMRLLRDSPYGLIYAAATLGLGCRLILGLTNGSFYPLPSLLFMWQVSGFALGLLKYDILRNSRPPTHAGNR